MLAKLNDFLTNRLSAAFINTIIELKFLANVFVCLLNITYEVNGTFQNETPRVICILGKYEYLWNEKRFLKMVKSIFFLIRTTCLYFNFLLA